MDLWVGALSILTHDDPMAHDIELP